MPALYSSKLIVMILSPFHCVVSALALPSALSFQATTLSAQQTAAFLKMNPDKSALSFGSDPRSDDVVSASSRHPHCDLPGDPSLILTTNVDLGGDKPEILKKLSALVASSLGKPESYVAISISDKVSMCFGGSVDPLALGCLYSIGSINVENNGKVQNGVTDALEPYGVQANRIYINFFDVPRPNVGWNRATFGG
mmetsp:Transcript_26994/g.55663  ORF Transcript_26994/g.55663 Transcript_26994/m.55663 type:complete len:196 (+) Transcript_26994:39-626(+)